MSLNVLLRRTARIIICGAVCLAALPTSARAADVPVTRTSLDQGFRLLYNLDFDQAHQLFLSWQSEHPQDPVGPTAEAAGLLFSEFHRLGILESQFYADDKSFLSREKVVPDPRVRDGFNAALARAQTVATARLASTPQDRDALFAMTLSSGLQADYAAMIEKHNLPSLRFTRQANDWAAKLLAVDPNCYDAHVATGFSKYIIGSMAAPLRWIMRLGGVAGDKKEGIAELELTAEHGHYLAPFARILLAIAYVRDKDTARARGVLAALRDEFPKNPLFAREISRLDAMR
ncbi:MAG TPA: hypothetical protein VK579_16590 [Terriglobales bacterium]|nr:hypothetical protein [Terriglobales bacterium]